MCFIYTERFWNLWSIVFPFICIFRRRFPVDCISLVSISFCIIKPNKSKLSEELVLTNITSQISKWVKNSTSKTKFLKEYGTQFPTEHNNIQVWVGISNPFKNRAGLVLTCLIKRVVLGLT